MHYKSVYRQYSVYFAFLARAMCRLDIARNTISQQLLPFRVCSIQVINIFLFIHTNM